MLEKLREKRELFLNVDRGKKCGGGYTLFTNVYKIIKCNFAFVNF